MNLPILFFVALFAGLIIAFVFIGRRRKGRFLRDISAFYRLQGAVELAVEDGSRVHISIGRSDITSPQSAAALIGLSMLRAVAKVASESDAPPIATSGDGVLAMLSQDTLRATYESMGLAASYENALGRVSGLTPYSFAAGTIHMVTGENVSANVLAGTFGAEAALISSAGERKQVLTLAGTDNLPGQAVLFATAHEPLIGEELYAAGAYMDAGPMHEASLHAQDIVRLIVIALIILSALGGFISGFFS